MADVYETRKDYRHELIALVKALTPALVLANAPKEAANNAPLRSLAERLEKTFSEYHVRQEGDSAYSSKRYRDALVFFELLRTLRNSKRQGAGTREIPKKPQF